MKFGILVELQTPKPWNPESELNAWHEGLEQLEVADRIGIDYLWQVEHHFLEEYSHSSASESVRGAASQRTKRIHLGSGVTLLPPPINHPARVAERVAALADHAHADLPDPVSEALGRLTRRIEALEAELAAARRDGTSDPDAP